MSESAVMEPTLPVLPAVAAGDRSAMESCLQRYEGLVWALARRMLGECTEAEDAVQEIFIELWRSAGRFDPLQGSEATFVATIARRRLMDALRRRARRPALISMDTDPQEDLAAAEEPDGMDDQALRALRVLRSLPSDQRRMMEWCLAEGLSHADISARTGTPLGTVKSVIRRGILRIREALGTGRGSP
jgi:RNA polymerase sigma factor (sigma-70 family)